MVITETHLAALIEYDRVLHTMLTKKFGEQWVTEADNPPWKDLMAFAGMYTHARLSGAHDFEELERRLL